VTRFLVLGWAAAGLAVAGPAAAADRPNVVVLITDDQDEI
jgi:hypothetical protein